MKAKKFFLAVSAAFTTASLSTAAFATSMLPTGALTGVQTDAIDTIKDIVTQMIPVVVGIMVAWSVLSYVKKGFGKAGVK